MRIERNRKHEKKVSALEENQNEVFAGRQEVDSRRDCGWFIEYTWKGRKRWRENWDLREWNQTGLVWNETGIWMLVTMRGVSDNKV